MSNKILQMMLLSTALTTPVVATSGGKDEDISNWLDRTSLSSGSSIPTIGDIGEDYETGSIASMAITDVQSVTGVSGLVSVSEKKFQDIKEIRSLFRRGVLEITPDDYQLIEQSTMLHETAAEKLDKGVYVKGWERGQELASLEKLLLRFTHIRKFKAEYSGQDLEGFAGVLEKSVQFYEALEELDLTGCDLGKGIEEIVLSLGKPNNLKILKVKGNKLGSDDVLALRKHLNSLSVLEVEEEVSGVSILDNKSKLELDPYNEGTMLELYQGVRNNDKSAGNELISLAESGDELAQSYLAICYKYGGAVVRDIDQAQHWAKKSINWLQTRAGEGLVAAQANLGVMYYGGLAVAQDRRRAVELYRKAADQGNALAQNNLGVCYQSGKGVKKNRTEAVKWVQKAAEQGYSLAQLNLGGYYSDGIGVEKDLKEAVKWWQKAADQGNAFAQCRLGVCYEIGKGIDKDIDIAVQLYTEAAKQGETYSQKRLKRLGKSW